VNKFYLGKRSIGRLSRVHPLLSACVCLAIKKTTLDFTVLEGVRSVGRQEQLYETGASQTFDSKHLVQGDGYCHAVDLGPLVDGKVPWDTWNAFVVVNEAMQKAAEELGATITWGGSWTSFKDGPHFQIEGV